MVGHWMGSIYGISGRRSDIRLSLGPDFRYEWMERFHNGQGQAEVGRWTTVEGETVLSLQPDLTTDRPRRWWVLAVTTCEDANTLLVLRQVILASRNLPILFYRVHCDGRGYGST